MKRVLSYGGGLDSLAMLLLAWDRDDLPDAVVFVDVADGTRERDGQDPGEWPGTYRHMREVVIPLCERMGVEFVWISSVDYPVRDARSLFAWMWARTQIPVSGPNRICTTVAKVERFERWAADRFPGELVEVWIGFEAGEEARAEKDPNARPSKKRRSAKQAQNEMSLRRNRFPLIEARLCRCRCAELVRAHELPVPRKSACVYCPYASRSDWQTFARELPEQFAQVVELEARKPPTSNGAKLSIRNFRTVKHADGSKTYKPTMLPVYVAGKGRESKPIPCGVCGASERATKSTGCGYLEDGPMTVREEAAE